MNQLAGRYYQLHNAAARLSLIDGLAPLLLRLYLVPVFWMAGSHKIDLTTLIGLWTDFLKNKES